MVEQSPVKTKVEGSSPSATVFYFGYYSLVVERQIVTLVVGVQFSVVPIFIYFMKHLIIGIIIGWAISLFTNVVSDVIANLITNKITKK